MAETLIKIDNLAKVSRCIKLCSLLEPPAHAQSKSGGRVSEVVVKVARNSSRFAPIWFLIRQTREGEAVDMSIHIGAEVALVGPPTSNPMQKAVGNLDRAQPALLG